MHKDEKEQLILEAKEYYFKIGAVPCPAFGGELVYFNRYGWNHLIRKDRLPRKDGDKFRRIQLIKYAPQVLAIVRCLADHEETTIGNSHAHFWAAHQKIDGIRIRIIIRQRNNGNKHFLSIMEEET